MVKGILMESDAGCCLAHTFRYLLRTNRTFADLEDTQNPVLIMVLSIVLALPGRCVFRMDLGANIHTPHCQLMYRMMDC